MSVLRCEVSFNGFYDLPSAVTNLTNEVFSVITEQSGTNDEEPTVNTVGAELSPPRRIERTVTVPTNPPANDADFSVWVQTFVNVAGVNQAAVGISAPDLASIQSLKNDLDAKLLAENTAKEASKAATAAKRVSRRNLDTQIAFRSKAVLANPNIPVNIKEALGLNVPTPRTSVPPVAPGALSVQPFANGINRLSWDRLTNITTTQYLIERKVSQSGAWEFVDVTTKTRYDHANQTPGQAILYRVKAKRGDLTSPASNETVAYADAAFPA